MVPFPRTTPSPDHPAGKSPPHFFPEGGVPKQIICLIWKKKNNKMQQNSNAWRVAPSSILRAKRKHILTLESVFALRSQYSEKKSKIMPQWSKYAPKCHQSVINRSTWQAWEHI